MANEVDYKPISYVGNGATKDFSFNWKVMNIDELIVQLENIETGELTTLNRGSDYTATINNVGGSVSFVSAPDASYYVKLSRSTSQYQSKGYSTSTGFQGSEIENSFDTVSCCLQDMNNNIETFKSDFTADITEQVREFEDDINNKLTEVNDAVDKLDRLDSVLETCEECAETSTQARDETVEAADIITSTYEEAKKYIVEQTEDSLNTIKSTGFFIEDGKMYYIDTDGQQKEVQITGNGFNLFDRKITDRVLTGDDALGWALQGSTVYADETSTRTGYPDFYEACIDKINNGTKTSRVIGSYSIDVYKSKDGQFFYDSTDETSVEACNNIYTTYGIADFYGVDQTNRCVTLPRNDWFEQLSGTESDINVFTNQGLPNIEGGFDGNGDDGASRKTGAFYQPGTKASGANGNTSASGYYIYFDASLSNSIYGNSEDVQPRTSKKLLYYCVGNCIVTRGTTAISEQIKVMEDEALGNIEADLNKATEQVEDLLNSALSQVDSSTTELTTKAEEVTTSSIAEIKETGENALTELKETSEEALTEIADNVQLAKDWACKTDGTVDGEEYSAKYYAEQTGTAFEDITDLSNTTIEEIKSASDNYSSAIKDVYNTAVSDINSAKNSAVEQLNEAVADIDEKISHNILYYDVLEAPYEFEMPDIEYEETNYDVIDSEYEFELPPEFEA